MPTPHEDEAKRAAERTGVVTVTVIAALITIGLVLLTVSRLNEGRPIGVSLWLGIVAGILLWVSVGKMWSRNVRSRQTPPSAS